MLTGYNKTITPLIQIFDSIRDMEFDFGILREPLRAVPAREPEDGKLHFITVRWS